MSKVQCPVCAAELRISPAKSRRAKHPKVFIMLVCPEDGRHFRGFINDQAYVNRVLDAAGVNEKATDPTPLGVGSVGG